MDYLIPINVKTTHMPQPRRKLIVLVASLVVVGMIAFVGASFLAGDGCLDSGGSWHYMTWKCER